MRLFQSLLILVGTLALGLVMGFFGLAFVVELLQKPSQSEPWTRGMGQLMGGLICGLPLGGLGGLALGILIVRNRRRETWHPAVWLGILVGALIGVAICLSWEFIGEFGPYGYLLVVPSSATLAGILTAGFADSFERAIEKQRRNRR